jgi:putative lysine transport system permease protein
MWEIFINNWESYLNGTWNTILISITGTIIGLVIGVLVAVIRTTPDPKNTFNGAIQKVFHTLLAIYVQVFRGTPMIVQSMVFYYGAALLWDWDMHPMTAALIIVSINTGAYLSEVVRGGIQSIDEGQFEGAKSIGMSHWQTMREVVMPQVFRNILPAVGNEFVINIKDTAVLNVISVNELFFTSNTIASTNYQFFETFMVTALIYLVLTSVVTWILGSVEKYMDGVANYDIYAGNQQQVAEISERGEN